jgi:hypothetical protein
MTTMTAAKFTPGAWHVASTGNHQGLVISETGANVAVTYDKADAPLVAAAPDFLHACRDALALLRDPDADANHANALEARLASLLSNF